MVLLIMITTFMGLRKDKMLIVKERYFVDTNAWIAIYDIKDQYHSQATTFLKGLLGKPILFSQAIILLMKL